MNFDSMISSLGLNARQRRILGNSLDKRYDALKNQSRLSVESEVQAERIVELNDQALEMINEIFTLINQEIENYFMANMTLSQEDKDLFITELQVINKRIKDQQLNKRII